MPLNHYSVSDVISSVTRQFGDESGVQITEDDIIRWTNTACMEMNSKNKILRARATVQRIPDSYTLEIPSDVMIITDILWVDSSLAPHRLEKVSTLDYYENYAKDATLLNKSDPKVWVWMQDGTGFIYVSPVGPDNATTFIINYVPEPPALNTSGDTLPLPDRYFDRIVEFVLSKAYELDENWQARQAMLSDFNQNMDTLNHAETDSIGEYLVVRDVDVM